MRLLRLRVVLVSSENMITGEVQSIGNKIVTDTSMFNYCATCHSSQGASTHRMTCMFDYKSKLANWRWLWAAFTKATEIEHVCYYKYNDDKDDNFKNNLLRS